MQISSFASFIQNNDENAATIAGAQSLKALGILGIQKMRMIHIISVQHQRDTLAIA